MSLLNKDVLSVIVHYLDHASCSSLFLYLKDAELQHLSYSDLECELMKLHKESRNIKKNMKRLVDELDSIDELLKSIQ